MALPVLATCPGITTGLSPPVARADVEAAAAIAIAAVVVVVAIIPVAIIRVVIIPVVIAIGRANIVFASLGEVIAGGAGKVVAITITTAAPVAGNAYPSVVTIIIPTMLDVRTRRAGRAYQASETGIPGRAALTHGQGILRGQGAARGQE